MRHLVWVLAILFGVTAGVRAEEDPLPREYGDTYTQEELSALDRALHAGNMTREDLRFRKDMTKGHACLPIVREMLADPLRIAPWMDDAARATSRRLSLTLPPMDAVEAALPWLAPAEPADPDHFDLIHAPPAAADLDAAIAALLDLGALPLDLATEDGPDVLAALRVILPPAMAWHDVFDSPYEGERTGALEEWLESRADAWLHETLAEFELGALAEAWWSRVGQPWCLMRADSFPESLWPTDTPRIVETPNGRIAFGTMKDDVYEGEFAFLVDPGGNDRYVNCRIGAAYGTENRRVGFFADLGGDDVYDCGDVNITLGAAVLGIAAFYDLGQGDDRYRGGHCSLGAAMGGIATFYDDGGSDTYEGKTFTQGAAGFGIGLFYDDAVQEKPATSSDEGTPDPVDIGLFDNDRLSAWANAQAFARCRGVALCINTRGNEIYEAGGVYLHAPLFADRYQSFSQGFAIGERGVDYAGGIAMLIDRDGNDRYLGDIYNQGVGYWYAAGLLWDGGGNDTYEMTQYGQGSGIHLAVGGLVDVAGHDTYVMHSGLGQGGSHDYAASILHDRGGNDRYHGNTSCNGSGLTNSVGLHFDRAGNDTYAARRGSGVNFGRPARGFGSVGVLLDLEGQDDYLGLMEDGNVWRHTDIGVGVDRTPPEAEPTAGGNTPAAGAVSGTAEIPEICSYEGDLTEEVFDELWAIAVRWEVGDNRYIVPEARKRLIAFGLDVLPYLDGKAEESASGLELRAYVDVLRALRAEGADDEAGETAVRAFLETNGRSEVPRRRRIALYLVGELKVKALGDLVAAMLAGEDLDLARRAAAVLEKLRSHAGDDTLREWLGRDDERDVAPALGALLGLEADVYADVRVLLDHPLPSVRGRLVALLSAHAHVYGDALRADLGATDLSVRARRTVLDILVRAKLPPDVVTTAVVIVLLEHDDWGVRGDAARLVRRWESLEGVEPGLLEEARAALAQLLETEEDPFVRFAGRPNE